MQIIGDGIVEFVRINFPLADNSYDSGLNYEVKKTMHHKYALINYIFLSDHRNKFIFSKTE